MDALECENEYLQSLMAFFKICLISLMKGLELKYQYLQKLIVTLLAFFKI
jgi:hypothetical protein